MPARAAEDALAALELLGRRHRLRLYRGTLPIQLPARTLLGTFAREALADGAALVLNDAETLWPFAMQLRREIEAVLARDVDDVTLFVTPTHSAPLGAHTDAEHTLAVQLAGTKIWRIAATAGAAQTTAVPVAMVADADTITVAPGDVLYVPAGTAHLVQAGADTSVSLSIGIARRTAADILRALVDERAKLLPELALDADARAAARALAEELVVETALRSRCDRA